MKRIITIATSDYIKYTKRLFISLLKTNHDFELTIFCDLKETFRPLEKLGSFRIIQLSEISKLGVKRAKFKAFYETAKKHDFLYLDSDILVLDSLDELFRKKQITGCFDDLSSCDFITNKEFPWKDPELRNNSYINSGIFFAPRSQAGFFKKIYFQSLKDEDWDTYTVPGKLLDNHFLCAMFNLYGIKVDYIDENIYNWQGFHERGRVQVFRKENELLNSKTGNKVKIIHFAGIQNIDDYIFHLPIEISGLLAESMVLTDPLQEEGSINYLASFSKSLSAEIDDANVPRMALDFFNEVEEIKKTHLHKDYSDAETYLKNKSSILSWVYSKPATNFTWNGLYHGGAYLTGDEYAYLRKFIYDQNIGSVFEVGAGETSVLFHQLVKKSIAIEPTPGPWLERAKGRGCQVYQVDFIPEEFRFSEEILSALFREVNLKAFDLLFLDSPVGTKNRRNILGQLAKYADFKYILVHDVFRDSQNIYFFQRNLGLNLLDYFPSERGLLVLGKSNTPLTTSDSLRINETLLIKNPDCDINYFDENYHFPPCSKVKIRVELTNKCDFIFSSHYKNPIYISYHWLDLNGNVVVHDGIRTVLPFCLFMNDSGEFPIDVMTPEQEGEYYLQVDLVQEGVAWFHMANPSLYFVKVYAIS